MSIRHTAVLAALNIIADGSGSHFWSGPDSDRDLVMADRQWLPAESTIVKRSLTNLISGSLDALSLPQFPVPAEFVAAAIALVVKPVNYMVACSWYVDLRRTDAMLNEEDERPISTEELFNGVLRAGEFSPEFLARFEAKFAEAQQQLIV